MKIIFKHADGLVIQEVENPQGKFLEWNQDFEDKIKLFILPNINENFTDIIETATQEDINNFNKQKLEQINKMQFEELFKTDWYYTRQTELGSEIPTDIINERKEIREKYNILKNQLK
jgi:hypothetical protein